MRVVMMGTGTFAEPTLEALIASSHQVVGLVTQPTRNTGSVRGSTRQTGRGMKTIADEYGIPTVQPERINTPGGISALTNFQADILVVAAYGQILSSDVLGTTPLGAINVHASLLPKYRGAAPIAWAIYHGERESGITIIRITLGLDAGEMLAQQMIPIDIMATAGEYEARVAPIGAKMAIDTLERISSGIVNAITQDSTKVTKAPKLKKENGLIDWHRPARLVQAQIRAMQPWPNAYTYWHSAAGKRVTRLIINSSEEVTPEPTEQAPGFYIADEKLLLVACSDNTVLSVLEVQPSGKRRMSITEFRRGQRFEPGDRFGPEVLI